ncbi:unknown [Clostridium sp. CAG:389]|nr:unknown [Clostridium sp. CAG:389]
MNWPGAMIILERMKNFSDVRTLSLAIQETISILDASNRENREVWLMTLSELLDNEKLEKELPINTLSELKRYYYKKEDFIERYTFYITKIQDAILENDYINNNIYEQKLKALNEEYEKEEYYIEALNELMENESFIIAMEAIKDCFKHNINIDKARKKVEELLKIEDVRIVSIKDWKVKHQKEKKEDV